MRPQTSTLGGALADRLAVEKWQRIGLFRIDEPIFTYAIDVEAARDWLYSVYAWVSLASGGNVLRIGKSQGPLGFRLGGYKRSLDDAMSGRLGPAEHFRGDTQPWEREGWIRMSMAPDGGLIFAQQILPATPSALVEAERAFIAEHDPPYCGVSKSGRANKQAWVAQYGRTVPVSKRRGK